MSSQLSMNDSQITATGSQKREIQSLGNAFDWNDFSDVESVDLDEAASDDEEEVIDFDEASRDMKEELGRVFYVGAKFKMMEDLREKAQRAIASEYDRKQLATVHVAECWMRRESYEWDMKHFGLTAWPNVMDLSILPTDDKDQLLKSEIKNLLKAKMIAILNKKTLFYQQIFGNFPPSKPSSGTFESIMNKLCNEASLDSRDNWFQFPEMVQLAADTFSRAIACYTPGQQNTTFVPCFSAPSPIRPILLQLLASHFYLIETSVCEQSDLQDILL
ncbi:hypothetical protein PS6_008317 [Mucor atramentarius]